MDKKYIRVMMSDITYLEAKGKYICVATTKKVHMVFASLTNAEEILPTNLFIRIHRCHMISLMHVTEFDNNIVRVGNKEFCIGDQYKGLLQEKVLTISYTKHESKNHS
jgi:DNA-binding LytR/AlgR family response regulator